MSERKRKANLGLQAIFESIQGKYQFAIINFDVCAQQRVWY